MLHYDVEKPIKFKVQAGMVCAFDPGNMINQRDSEITHVLIHNKVKHRFRGKSVWLVQNADDIHSDVFTCPEYLLKPINASVMRFPANVPEFNDLDIDTLEYFAKLLSREETLKFLCKTHNELANPFDIHSNYSISDMEKKVNRLKAIYDKIKFCKELRDI